MTALLALLGAELTRLVRTEQVHRYMLLPALLLLPLAVMGGTLVASTRSLPVVAVPETLPWALDLGRHLEAEDLRVEPRADPLAAFQADEVDAALVVEAREGISTARPWEAADPARYVIHLATASPGVDRRVRRAADRAGDQLLGHDVVLAGGDPDTDLAVADLSRRRMPRDGDAFDLDLPRAVRAYGAFLLGAMGFVFLSLAAVADREEGVTEVLRTLPIAPATTLWARVLALVLLQLVAAGLVLFNVLLLLAHASAEVQEILPSPWALPSFVAVLVASDAAYGAVGVFAPSAKAANNGASLAMFVIIALLVAGTLAPVPAWVPVAGFVTATTPEGHLLATVTTLAVAAVVIQGTGRALARQVGLVLPAGSNE